MYMSGNRCRASTRAASYLRGLSLYPRKRGPPGPRPGILSFDNTNNNDNN